MNSTRLAATVLVGLFCVSNVCAQEYDQVEIETVKITDGVYMLSGYGGNIGVSVGEDGTLLIDDQFGELKDKIDAALSEISPHPVRIILNTNWHYDHASGNAAFVESGATVIAHEQSRVRMMSDQRHPDLGISVPPYPAAALPLITINESLTLHFNGDEILVFHIPNAHSDADLAFYFRNANVMHTGDLFFVGGYPYIDVFNGGSIDGTIAAADRLIGMIDEPTTRRYGCGAHSCTGDCSLCGAGSSFAAGQELLRRLRQQLVVAAQSVVPAVAGQDHRLRTH
jgi:glyoxylase-like metal-dependent hydrolase (beta-lactamase superfamily II)